LEQRELLSVDGVIVKRGGGLARENSDIGGKLFRTSDGEFENYIRPWGEKGRKNFFRNRNSTKGGSAECYTS